LSKFLDESTSFAQIVARKAGKEVMGDLEMKTAMKKAQIIGTDNVGGRAQLPVYKGFGGTEIGG